MKATIERATLLKSLSHVQSVVERRNTIPILSNVLIEAREDGSIRLMATDLDLQVDESVPANVGQAGATTVSAHTLFDIVRKLPEGSQVELNAAEGKMQLSAGRARFNLSTLPRDDFPVIAEGELPTRFELPAATLRQIIDKTRFAISTEETRYYLMGIFLHVADDQLKAAATDGHRLARVTVPKPDGADGMPDVIVPRKCVAELRKLLDELEGTVEVSMSRNEDPFRPWQRGPDQQADRRHLPRLQSRHPDRERQAAEARSEDLRAGRRPRLDHREREDPGGQDQRRSRQGDPVGHVAGKRHGDRGARRPTMGRKVSRSASTPATCSTSSVEIDGDSVEVHLADAAAPTLSARERQEPGALRPHAHAGVMICRLWRGWTTPENADDYERIVRNEVIPEIEARKIPGFRHVDLMKRDLGGEIEFQTLMWFDSLDAIKAFMGEDYSVSHVPLEARAVLNSFDDRAAHFEVLDRREQ